MRWISAGLASVQGKLDITPAFSLYALEGRFGIPTPRWTALYAGDEPAHGCDAAVCRDGSIVRAGIDDALNLRWARVTDPADPAGWSGWTSVATTVDVPPAVVADPQSDEVSIFFVGAIGRTLRAIHSADNGATWGAPETIVVEPNGTAITGIAGVRRAQGPRDTLVFYTLDAGGVGADDVLRVVARPAGGAWGAPATWTQPALYATAGIDAVWQGDFYIALAGRDLISPYAWRLWMLVYGDGGLYPAGSWGAPVTVDWSDNLDVTYSRPSLCLGDLGRLVYVESVAGQHRTMMRAHLSLLPLVELVWREAEPLAYAPPAGAGPALAWDQAAGALYLVGHNAAWRGDVGGYSADLGPRLLGYEYEETPAGGSLVVTLDNHDGALAAAGAAGTPYAALCPGGELLVQRGAVVAGVAEKAALPRLRVEALEWRPADGGATLAVRCIDWWGVLRHWRAGRLLAWEAGAASVFRIATDLLAQVGLAFFSDDAIGCSGPIALLRPAFAVPPGTDGATALRRLLARAADLVRFDGSFAVVAKALREEGDEPAAAAVGGAGHPLLRGSLAVGAAPANLAEVYGAGVFGEALGAEAAGPVGLRRRQVDDGTYTLAADAATRAATELRRAAVETYAGALVVRPLFGLELWDVLEVSVGGGAPARRRVAGIREVWDRRRGVFEQRLTLGYP